MKIFSFTVFFVSCFFCSWFLHAAHKEKREEVSGKATGMVRARSEEALVIAQEEDPEEGEAAAKRASPSVSDFIKSILDRSSVKKGLLSLSGLLPEGFFDQFSAFSETKQLVLMRMSLRGDDTIPFTSALKTFSKLEHLAVRQSTIGDGMFFFLGMQVPKLPMLRSLVLDGNECHMIGLKAFLIGVAETDQLKRFSWRRMPLSTHKIPWETTGLLKKKGSYRAEVTTGLLDLVTGVSTPRTKEYSYVEKTHLRFLFEDAFPRLKLEHLDLGGSIVVKSKEDREELMEFFSTVPTMFHLTSLGLSEIPLDEFSARALSKALVLLQEAQLLHSGDRSARVLQELDLSGIFRDKAVLKDLEGGIKALRHLRVLNLSRNVMGTKGTYFLMTVLPDLRELMSMNLSHNNLFGDSRSMVQSGKRLGEVLSIRKDTLRHLNLSGNGMEDRDFTLLKEALLEMRLETLDLRDNLLTDRSIGFLREFAKKKYSLKTILVSRNKMTTEGLQRLADAGIIVDIG
ncbi:hypothetical protein OAN21_01925 [Alphaproteobacteria bacterium]|nr:hypothetical protein [Alphaproteobacteria bacterium]